MASDRSRLNAADRFYIGLLVVGGLLAVPACLGLVVFTLAGVFGAFG
ncbi:hypothetical protein SOM08_06140 [Hydrogenophaga sp. SNF1]|nr:hypothetical protein [Hydrogenophaga sp. SNF1]WQB84891.1 hypothetical protein SOM08_06140 [Hydrogenophaga sp. SNF1]